MKEQIESVSGITALDLGRRGREAALGIVGIALSPEYVYEVGGGAIFPDSGRFGVLWLSRETLGPAFNMTGAFNDVTLALAPGASEPEVILPGWTGCSTAMAVLAPTLTLLAIPLGFLLGYGLCAFLVQRLAGELYRIPLVISGATFLFAVGVVAAAALLSGLLVARPLQHLDLIAVLKAQE